MTVTEACYWIVGLDTDSPALVYDLHNEKGELIGETRAIPKPYPMDDIMKVAVTYIHNLHKLPKAKIFFDNDSTDFFRGC